MVGSFCREANSTICSRRSRMIGSVPVMIASALTFNSCSNAASISDGLLALRVTVSRPSCFVPLTASASSTFIFGLVGFISSATRETVGAISRTSSTRFAPRTFWFEEDTGHVPARAVYTFDQPKTNRVTANRENHRHGTARELHGARRSNVSGGCNRCCARAAKGNAVAALPISAMNSRRLIAPPSKHDSRSTRHRGSARSGCGPMSENDHSRHCHRGLKSCDVWCCCRSAVARPLLFRAAFACRSAC